MSIGSNEILCVCSNCASDVQGEEENYDMGYEDDFADLLNRYRGRTGFTQEELGRKIGVHRTSSVRLSLCPWFIKSVPEDTGS